MKTLFESNKRTAKLEKARLDKKEKSTMVKDGQDKAYCLNQIKTEPYLWDMRCWKKSKKQHTIADILKWIDNDCEPNNCGHATWCIRKLLKFNWATKKEIAEAVLSNPLIEYQDEIGTWEKNISLPF